ncbi:hypothetical protein EST38_g10968 [Candolleomyces aberdarensis]|uniref:Nephrocystin 3-like N-terminal domain-containing protein n=1 Tax=Candolleomyces aberdarensis TaxID=2316362 RepID=A0A4Q2D8B9_9AGAR|nr:hypothetical protein EST38_g10968 [Candolleomyces aberdarensis]
MPPKPKKRSVLSRLASLFNCDGSKSRTEDSASAGSAPSHPSTRSDPELLLPVGNSTLQTHGFRPPAHQFRSENDGIAASSQSTPLSMPEYQTSMLRTPQQPRDGNPAGAERRTSFFSGASGFRTGDIQYFEASNITVNTGGEKSIDGWELLLKNIAQSALHDSSVRYDAPKCDEDTRVEVTGEIMDWIQDRTPIQRLLCMTGAAGAGKSALQQTIAERCTGSDILAAAFFFSSTDPTRNTASAIVPTIAYQIGLKHLLFQSSIVAAVKRDPLIFSRSLKSQMEALIVRPFENLRGSNQIDIDTFPHAILIDGLDECSGARGTLIPTHVEIDVRHQAEDQQAELLDAIRHCILDNDLPFRVFLASRPEWAIRTALEPGGHLRQVAYHIRLSDEYDASGDMRRYLQRRFEVIGVRIRNPQWFTEEDIEGLAEAASGQFVYVATVFKYISERRASPAERLKAVLTWTPHVGQTTRPFEALDRLYTNIVLSAKNAYEAVDTHHGRDFLLLLATHHINGTTGFDQPDNPANLGLGFFANDLSALLSLRPGAEDNLFSDLRSLMTLETAQSYLSDGDGLGNVQLQLRLYHKSFSDFFKEECRAKNLFVPPSCVYRHLAKCCMQHIVECPLFLEPLPDTWDELSLPQPNRAALNAAVCTLTLFLCLATAIDDEVADFTHKGGWPKLDQDLAVREPEVASVISGYVGKWGIVVEEPWRDSKDEKYDSTVQTSRPGGTPGTRLPADPGVVLDRQVFLLEGTWHCHGLPIR